MDAKGKMTIKFEINGQTHTHTHIHSDKYQNWGYGTHLVRD